MADVQRIELKREELDVKLELALSNYLWKCDPPDSDSSKTSFTIDQYLDKWSDVKHKFNNNNKSWQTIMGDKQAYVTPCPASHCSSLKQKMISCSFRLYPHGEVPTVDDILSKQGVLALRVTSESLALLFNEAKDVQLAPMMVVKAAITDYSTKGLFYPVRATLNNSKGHALPVPLRSHTVICNYDGQEDKGVLLLTNMDAVKNENALYTRSTWLTYHDTSNHLKWMNRLSRMDEQVVRRHITELKSSSNDGVVQVPMRYNADGIAQDLVTWMTGHFYPFLVEHATTKEQIKLPTIETEQTYAPATRAGLLTLLDCLVEYSGCRQVMDVKNGFSVQLKIGETGKMALLPARNKELKTLQRVDQMDRDSERVATWVEIWLDYYAYHHPQVQQYKGSAVAPEFGQRYRPLEGSTVIY